MIHLQLARLFLQIISVLDAFYRSYQFKTLFTRVAEPPLFCAAPAPDGQGPGADPGSGSDLLGSAPAPVKKRRLQAAPAPGSATLLFTDHISSRRFLQIISVQNAFYRSYQFKSLFYRSYQFKTLFTDHISSRRFLQIISVLDAFNRSYQFKSLCIILVQDSVHKSYLFICSRLF